MATPKKITFQFDKELLLEYFAWMDSPISPRQIIRIYGMWMELNMETVGYIFATHSEYINFMPALRRVYPQMTGAETAPLFCLLTIQNNWPSNQSILKRMKDASNTERQLYPKIFGPVGSGHKVETPPSVSPAPTSQSKKRGYTKRKRVRGESIPLFLGKIRAFDGGDFTSRPTGPPLKEGYYPDPPEEKG